jgi:hypothetical protein
MHLPVSMMTITECSFLLEDFHCQRCSGSRHDCSRSLILVSLFSISASSMGMAAKVQLNYCISEHFNAFQTHCQGSALSAQIYIAHTTLSFSPISSLPNN